MLTVLRQLHIPAVLHFIAYPHRETGQRLDREQELLKASCSLAYQLAETLPDYASFSADFDFGAHMEAMQASSEADPIAATNAAIDLIEKFLSMGPPLLFCLVDGIQLLESYKNPPRLNGVLRRFVAALCKPLQQRTSADTGGATRILKVLASTDGHCDLLQMAVKASILVHRDFHEEETGEPLDIRSKDFPQQDTQET